MKKYILLVLLLKGWIAHSQNIILLDSITKTPIPSVVIENGKGVILGISDDKGQLIIDKLEDINYTSHISYNPKKITKNALKNVKNLYLSPKEYELSEVVVENKHYDYTILKSYFRTYQYADSIPIYYTEGFVDFYIPKKGNNLKYNLLSAKVYKNTKDKKVAEIERGTVFMKDNGIINFLVTTIFPYSKDYEIVKKSERDYSIAHKGQIGAGNIQKTEGVYRCYLNGLFPQEVFKGSFMGRTNVIRANDVYQEFPADISIEDMNLADFTLYRCFRNIETTHKNSKVDLVNIFEVYPIRKVKVSKSDMKNVRLESYYGNIEKSTNIEYFEKQTYEKPKQSNVFQSLLETDLKLLTE